jgi:hypothetical protein
MRTACPSAAPPGKRQKQHLFGHLFRQPIVASGVIQSARTARCSGPSENQAAGPGHRWHRRPAVLAVTAATAEAISNKTLATLHNDLYMPVFLGFSEQMRPVSLWIYAEMLNFTDERTAWHIRRHCRLQDA